MTLRILAVGDIHLGRLPGSVPADVAAWAGDRERLGPREAWSRTVDAAIAEGVAAVLLLGDVVEDEECYSEAWPPLETGLRKLIAAGIEVLAVAGNHDVRVLPELAKRLSGLRLIGPGGVWEAAEIARGSARIVGWSYRTAHERLDPTLDTAVEEILRVPHAGPTIGLLHGDLDVPKSDFARFSKARLVSLGADAWLLGHIHSPNFAHGERGAVACGYLGSLTGLDPTETGVHGPWLLEFEARSLVEARQLPIAPLRWDKLQVAVDAWSSVRDLEAAIIGALQEFESRERTTLGGARAVGLRFELVGRSPFHRELRAEIERFPIGSVRPVLEERLYFVDAVIDHARPALDLDELARHSNPPGLLAQRLLLIGKGPDDPSQARERVLLVQLARREMERLASQSGFQNLPREDLSDDALAKELYAAGLVALDDLLATRRDREVRA
jgi:predicted phosphodiesterase